MLRPVWADVDLGAVHKNITVISGLLEPDTLIMAVVKADAYGHGALPVTRKLLAGGVEMLYTLGVYGWSAGGGTSVVYYITA